MLALSARRDRTLERVGDEQRLNQSAGHAARRREVAGLGRPEQDKVPARDAALTAEPSPASETAPS